MAKEPVVGEYWHFVYKDQRLFINKEVIAIDAESVKFRHRYGVFILERKYITFLERSNE